MKPVIGIILRESLSESNKIIGIIYEDMINAVIKSGGIPIGISNNNIDLYLDICQGFILQGGDEIDNNNLEVLKILKDRNVPVLGICLGMQEMAYFDNGVVYDINNHTGDILHEIIINEDSLLYKIINEKEIVVNSRHKSAVKDSKLFNSSYSYDKIVESVEYSNNKFYLGLQWHPESIYDKNLNAKKIFDYFIKICQKYICNK